MFYSFIGKGGNFLEITPNTSLPLYFCKSYNEGFGAKSRQLYIEPKVNPLPKTMIVAL